GEAAKLADIEIDPAHVIALALPGNEHHLGLDRAGIADHAAAGLDDRFRNPIAEVPAQRPENGGAVALHARHIPEVLRRKAATEIDHRKGDAAIAAVAEYGGSRAPDPTPAGYALAAGPWLRSSAIQSVANSSPPQNSLLTGKITGNLAKKSLPLVIAK